MKQQSGFGLIEVMIALVILALTAGSLLQLSQQYLSYSRDGRAREVALRLVESRLDELRHQQASQGYNSLASGSDMRTLMDINFTINWTVQDQMWSATQGLWLASASVISDKKDVSVSLTWQDSQGELNSITLASAIAPISAIYAGPFGERYPL
ncbi:MAG: type IV pilus modification PilV family protein [Oceanisphaera sp.]|uniref:type IV pilus modification PilV family protein n=1 Tax=Oceanisphaera sp. TaxID=1929979 RepID=UPI003F98FE19